jgi:hypothetical protein
MGRPSPIHGAAAEYIAKTIAATSHDHDRTQQILYQPHDGGVTHLGRFPSADGLDIKMPKTAQVYWQANHAGYGPVDFRIPGRGTRARVVLPGTIYNFDPRETPVAVESSPQRPNTRSMRAQCGARRKVWRRSSMP